MFKTTLENLKISDIKKEAQAGGGEP
jgi:hypothetical protein